MSGTKLIPLNQMPESMSKIRNLHLSKYVGREEILKRKIPLLECLWNDVVQFLPLHPIKVFDLQVAMKFVPEIPQFKFFEIDIKTLNPKHTVVFFKNAAGEENVTVKWLKDVDFDLLQEIPQATVEYYKSLAGTGELPFNYQFIPHILYMGSVDVSNTKLIAL